MGKPALTADTRIYIGGSGWLADLTTVFNGWSTNETVTTPGEPASTRYWNKVTFGTYEQSVTLETLYYGDETKVLADRDTGILVLIAGPAGVIPDAWFGGGTTWLGLPESAPLDDVVTNNVELLRTEPWAHGLNVTDFVFSTGDVSEAITAIAPNQICYLVISEKTVAGARVVTISDGTDTVTQSVTTAGIYPIDVSSLAVGAGTISVAAIAGDQTIEGAVVFGTVTELPS